MSKTVAVFFGGKSNEREISVITGMLAVNLLRNTSYQVVPVYLSPTCGLVTGDFRGVEDFKKGASTKFVPVRLEGKKLVKQKRGKMVAEIACALNCCHGGIGEDGTMSAVLRFFGVPSASPETPMSAVFMDKILTKIAACGLSIPVADAFAVYETEWNNRDAVLAKAENFGYPVVVKPAKLGSSIGIKVAKNAAELVSALDLAFRLDDSALIEQYFAEKRDVNCAAYRKNGEIVLSPLEEVFSDEAILTFSEKYEGRGERNSKMPAELSEELAEQIRTYTRRIYATFAGKGVVRADFLVVGDKVYFNELNTVPGSLSCYLFGDSLTESRDFLVSLIEETLAHPSAEKETLTSGILNGDLFSGKGGKRR